jgi:putative transcription factor
MVSCELCGRNPSMYSCEIEGTTMKVCQDCSRFGNVKGKSNVRIVYQEKKPIQKDPEYVFIEGYGASVKNSRERKGLTQEDFAKSINEHKSLIHQVESESIKPSIIFARKLERALNVKIVEEVKSDASKIPEEEPEHPMNSIKSKRDESKRITPSSGPLTLGDLMNIKKK